MGIYDNFPYTNVHELNLQWILKVCKQSIEVLDELPENMKKTILELIDSGEIVLALGENYDAVNEALTLFIE